jgi:glucose-6-phosphate dehydrogenase assembly protein OpcA
MSAPSTAPLQVLTPRPVDIAAIDSALAQLLTDPRTPDAVTRACMSNLMIYSPTTDEAQRLQAEIAVIVQHHPARVLLLVGAAPKGSAGPIEASVSAFCSLAGAGRHICSEHVTITAAPGAARRLPSVVRPLLIGDLPTALWWATNEPPPLGGDLFHELAAMSGQVIYESQGWLDPVRSMVATADWAASKHTEQVIADLEWRRLKTWRRAISQSLDPAVVPGALESITEVRFEHGPHALAKTWLLVGWLASKLGWRPEGGKVAPGVDITWKFHADSGPVRIVIRRLGEGEPKVVSGSVTWKIGGHATTARFVRLAAGRLGILGEDPKAPPRMQVMPSQSRAELVAKQLPDLGRDDLFRETLQVARTMAEALLH